MTPIIRQITTTATITATIIVVEVNVVEELLIELPLFFLVEVEDVEFNPTDEKDDCVFDTEEVVTLVAEGLEDDVGDVGEEVEEKKDKAVEVDVDVEVVVGVGVVVTVVVVVVGGTVKLA